MRNSSSPQSSKSEQLAEKILDVIPRSMQEIRGITLARPGETLPLPQFRVLANIWKKSKTNKQLAEDIGLSISAMSRVISSMEDQGWIKKTANPQDRRYSDIFITKKGLNLFKSIRTHTCNTISEHLDSLSLQEKQLLHNGLNIIEKIMVNSCPN